MGKFTIFARIAEIEFSEIVISSQDLDSKLRIYLIDKSFIDFFYSTKTKTQRFAIHWERQHADATIYRIDNTPDKKWRKVKSFPIHFHSREHSHVIDPPFNLKKNFELEDLLRSFLVFTRTIIIL